MIILNEEDDKKLFYKMIDIIEHSDKKILLAYKHEQGEMGAMYRLPQTTKSYYTFSFSTINGLYDIIEKAKNEKFDTIIVYHNKIKPEYFDEIKKYENEIEIVIADVSKFAR